MQMDRKFTEQGALQSEKILKSEITLQVGGWVQVSLKK